MEGRQPRAIVGLEWGTTTRPRANAGFAVVERFAAEEGFGPPRMLSRAGRGASAEAVPGAPADVYERLASGSRLLARNTTSTLQPVQVVDETLSGSNTDKGGSAGGPG